MTKPKPTTRAPAGLVYSTDRAYIVRLAREKGLTDAEILTSLVQNEFGDKTRRKIIREWATHLGLSEEEALQLAKGTGLISR